MGGARAVAEAGWVAAAVVVASGLGEGAASGRAVASVAHDPPVE